ncbi:13238_t:CDS:10 [Dentiscutata erythropus]|uniref:13238_t:CDS:1 n=1 Tax=Dentiscutata erythropus TaxID=1348616 RepID=A0A9N9HZ44_9GLOM|nr:13238_t:CDS:10 [Dentiscutata erythropus]
MDSYEQNSRSPTPPIDDTFSEEFSDEMQDSLNPPAIDLYGVLNVPKEATDEQIKESYKRLCRTFHPDKHVDPENKRAAETKFQVIQRAYEVLTDPTKRTIYDMFGEEGLNTSWEVGTRLKTPQELREEFERQAKLKKEHEIENLVKSKGDIQLSIDATQLFDPYDGVSHRRENIISPSSIFEKIEITQLFMKHSFETQLKPQTQGFVVGQTILRNGVGGGNIVGSIRHTFSPHFWAEVGSSVVQPRITTAKANYSFGSNGFFTVTAQSQTISSPPILSFTAGRRLGENTSGYLSYKTGAWALGPWGQNESYSRRERSSVAIGINSSMEKSGYGLEIQACDNSLMLGIRFVISIKVLNLRFISKTGLAHSYISANYNRKLFDIYQIRAVTTLSTSSGLTAILLGERKVAENTKLAMAMEFGIPGGITLRCRLSRLGQRITVPIHVSSEYNFNIALWGTLLPVITIVAVEQIILGPRRKKKAAKKLAILRERHAEFISTRKREAEEAIRLLQPSVERKVEAEMTKDNGLIILEAWYGNFSHIKEASAENHYEDVIDVKIPIQALVFESQLIIPGGCSKSNIIGFYDPCMGERKQLKIKYHFQRKLHEVIVEDKTPVACPLRSHIVPNNR